MLRLRPYKACDAKTIEMELQKSWVCQDFTFQIVLNGGEC